MRMPKRFTTLEILPAPDGRRFTTVTVGMTHCQTIRDEFTELRGVAADICGIAPEELTVDHLAAHRAAIAQAVATFDPEQFAVVRDTPQADRVQVAVRIALQALASAKYFNEHDGR